MTDTEVSVEALAQRVAARGRDALVERLRTAYADAAAAHADLISLDGSRIEAMVQSAADRADGLQWRRALAGVAAEELNVNISEALSHPAVVRAQELIGAPSYQQSLAELIARPVPPASLPATSGNGSDPIGGGPEPEPPEPAPEPIPDPEPPAPEPPEPESEPAPTAEYAAVGDPEDQPAQELETVEADDAVLELMPEPDPVEYATEVYEVQPAYGDEPAPIADEPEPVPPTPEPFSNEPVADEAGPEPVPPDPAEAQDDDQELTIHAIHLGGVANLPTKRDGLSVRLSADGLDILQGERDILGRLIWDEIEALEVPHLRHRRRHKQLSARLVVRTPHGDASFEIPDVSADELRDRVEPIVFRYGRR